MRKLLDFDVVIDSHGDGYRARVVASPAGEAQAGFVLPFTDKDLTILVFEVVRRIGKARRKVRQLASPERLLLQDFGGQLFQAVFSGPVRECLGHSRLAAESESAGLRIRLRLPGALANIPWEYLYDAEYGFLGLSREIALVRYVEMPTPVQPFPVSPPLRILAMISAPDDEPGLQGEEEWGKLKGALDDLAGRGMVQVDRLEAGTLAALQRPLRLREYHVLHFIGHGGYNEEAQDGALALETEGRKTRLVTGRDLGVMFRGHRSLRLVVLNACEGARTAQDDPFGGVAQALVRQGIPAVIAMQFEISDPAALVFSQSFYQAIGDGLPVDVATVEARVAMFAADHEVEWATPVLYLRSPDGQIFTTSQAPPAGLEAREGAQPKAGADAEPKSQEDDRAAREEAAGGTRREDDERTAIAESEREARDDDERRAKEYAERAAREEDERKARQKAERKAREKAEKTFDRGERLKQQGDLAGAQAAYQEVTGSGHPDYAPKAAANLGVLLAVQGDIAGAKAALQRAIDSGHPDAAPMATGAFGGLLHDQGDVAGARAAYQKAIDSGHPDATPMAAVWLGDLLQEQGDVAGARAAYQKAIDSGHGEAAPEAAVGLGQLLQRQGDMGGAKAAYQQAIDSGDPVAAPRAAVNLGNLLTNQSDVAGARAAYQKSIDSGHPDAAPEAAFGLGYLLGRQGDAAGARAAYQKGIGSGHADQAPRAAVNLGDLLWQQGDVAGARAAYQKAIASGHPEAAAMAAHSLRSLPWQ